MISRFLTKLIRFYQKRVRISPESAFGKCLGVIHVGANDGAERYFYRDLKLPVIWVEPLAEPFAALQKNIAGLEDQKCYQYLLLDTDHQSVTFNVASNSGKSSSIFEFSKHKVVFPHVKTDYTVQLSTRTLDSIVEEHNIDLSQFNCLVLDTQGAELLVLQGAGKTLQEIKYVIAESANFESYTKSCKSVDLERFLGKFGFVEQASETYFYKFGVGSYYNILYVRDIDL